MKCNMDGKKMSKDVKSRSRMLTSMVAGRIVMVSSESRKGQYDDCEIKRES